MTDLVPVWNGSLERTRQAAGLSGYLGPSQLACYRDKRIRDRSKDGLNSTALAAKVSKQTYGPLPTPGQVRDRLRRGYSLRRVAMDWRLPLSVIRKLKDTY